MVRTEAQTYYYWRIHMKRIVATIAAVLFVAGAATLASADQKKQANKGKQQSVQTHHCKKPDGTMDMKMTHRECKQAKGQWVKDADQKKGEAKKEEKKAEKKDSGKKAPEAKK